MAYTGAPPYIGDIPWQVANGDGSTTSFTLAANPGSANGLEVFVNGVIQLPGTHYSVSGTTLTFLTAPSSGTANIAVLQRSRAITMPTPSAGVIVDNMVSASAAIAPTKLLRPYDYILLQDVRTSGTVGQSLTLSTWNQRNLNTVTTDTTGSITLSSNQFVLPAGTYEVFATAPMHQSVANSSIAGRIRLQNMTDSTTTLLGGTAQYASAVVATVGDVTLRGRFTIASSKTFEIEHYVFASGTPLGGGASSIASINEIYTQIELRRVGL